MVHLILILASFNSCRDPQNCLSGSAPPPFFISKFLKAGSLSVFLFPHFSISQETCPPESPGIVAFCSAPFFVCFWNTCSKDTSGASDSSCNGLSGVVNSEQSSHEARERLQSYWMFNTEVRPFISVNSCSSRPLPGPSSAPAWSLHPLPWNPGYPRPGIHLVSRLRAVLVVKYFEYRSWAQKGLDLNPSSSTYHHLCGRGQSTSSL